MLLATLKRAAGEFRRDNLTDWAAALTYYSLLSLFPALIAMVLLIGLSAEVEEGQRGAAEEIQLEPRHEPQP